MPLDSLTKFGALQCKAKAKRSQCRCLNPAAFEMKVCRLHGARRPETILKGSAHPLFKHGRETLEAKQESSAAAQRLRILEELMHQLEMVPKGTYRTRGRKPGA
jgi:hypothetical protein